MPAVVTFGELLAAYIKREKLTYRDFAKKAGIPPTKTSHFVSGIRTPPLEKVGKMVTALHLDEQEAAEFMEAAYLAHAPEEVRLLVSGLRSQLAKAAKQHALLVSQHALIVAELKRLGIKLPQGVRDV
jgi:predicted transcriptional regulator